MLPSTREQFLGVFVVWSLIGGNAAFRLGIPQDWPLLVSGVSVLALLRPDVSHRQQERERSLGNRPTVGLRPETP